MAIEVFWASGSPFAWRVLLALEIKGVPYTGHLLSFADRDHKAEAYLALNPRGKVPVLVADGHAVYESAACVAYLDDLHPEPPLFGTTPAARGTAWQWVACADNHAWPVIARVVRPLFFGGEQARADDVRAAIPEVWRELDLLEARLGEATWVSGPGVGAADCAWYPLVASLERAARKPGAAAFELGLLPLDDRWPAVGAWMRRVEALPGFARTWPPHWDRVPRA